jgi:putative lipoic acid-binding regulatory protein
MPKQWETKTRSGHRLKLTKERHQGRGNLYEITEAGLQIAAFDEEQAEAIYELLRKALEKA